MGGPWCQEARYVVMCLMVINYVELRAPVRPSRQRVPALSKLSAIRVVFANGLRTLSTRQNLEPNGAIKNNME